jgi:Holliday junction DNA helicase RuvA
VFESIQGRLAAKDVQRVVVETGGVGWAVQVPLSDFDALPAAGAGADVRLLLHVDARDDGWRLFGFLRSEDRDAFRRLLRVGGVGPQTALTILSGIGVKDLAGAVLAGDVDTLQRVKGIGKKTAALIVAELKEDARKGLLGAPAGRSGSPLPEGTLSDALKALLALGLDVPEARRRLEAVPDGAKLAVGDLVKAALRRS